jgi:hypothetical protein
VFWKNTDGLKNINVSSKIAITAFLILAGIGYLFGFFNILLSYSPVDQEPGLSLEDIQISFYGSRGTTTLEKSIDGTMLQYLGSDKDSEVIKNWIQAGANESEFQPVKDILDTSCNMCHSSAAQVAQVVTETYEDVQQYIKQDTGKSIQRLVSISHTHWLSTLVVIFLMVFIFSFTTFSERLKIIVMSIALFSLPLDIGSWWLAKLAPVFSILVIVGGSFLGLSFLLLIVFSLYDMWLKKETK